MPELVEVEVARRLLDAQTAGATLLQIVPGAGTIVAGLDVRVEGVPIRRWVRKGKLLGAPLGVESAEQPWLLCHLGMTGKWVSDLGRKHERARLETSQGAVAFVDPRRFGWLRVASAAEARAAWSAIGPDAWHEPLSPDGLFDALSRRHGPLKQVLMDQRLIGGLGNIAVVDITFMAGLHPHRPASRCSLSDCAALVGATRRHLERLFALHADGEITYLSEGGESPGLVYGKDGSPCPRCGATLVLERLQGRPTVYCGGCQRP
ncbi:MAG: Fpg/Nei family DNA glycosylase [Myxococcales bacterium]|nr:Fpg/Nei family DNA glycosylase [Myxococcales bacterium]